MSRKRRANKQIEAFKIGRILNCLKQMEYHDRSRYLDAWKAIQASILLAAEVPCWKTWEGACRRVVIDNYSFSDQEWERTDGRWMPLPWALQIVRKGMQVKIPDLYYINYRLEPRFKPGTNERVLDCNSKVEGQKIYDELFSWYFKIYGRSNV